MFEYVWWLTHPSVFGTEAEAGNSDALKLGKVAFIGVSEVKQFASPTSSPTSPTAPPSTVPSVLMTKQNKTAEA